MIKSGDNKYVRDVSLRDYVLTGQRGNDAIRSDTIWSYKSLLEKLALVATCIICPFYNECGKEVKDGFVCFSGFQAIEA